jgi:hypothetical protein
LEPATSTFTFVTIVPSGFLLLVSKCLTFFAPRARRGMAITANAALQQAATAWFVMAESFAPPARLP